MCPNTSFECVVDTYLRWKVRLVQKTDTGKIYAMKTLKKEEMLKKDQVI